MLSYSTGYLQWLEKRGELPSLFQMIIKAHPRDGDGTVSLLRRKGLNKKWEVMEKEMDTGWNQQISITIIYFILNGRILTGTFLPNQFF